MIVGQSHWMEFGSQSKLKFTAENADMAAMYEATIPIICEKNHFCLFNGGLMKDIMSLIPIELPIKPKTAAIIPNDFGKWITPNINRVNENKQLSIAKHQSIRAVLSVL